MISTNYSQGITPSFKEKIPCRNATDVANAITKYFPKAIEVVENDAKYVLTGSNYDDYIRSLFTNNKKIGQNFNRRA